MTNKHIAHRRQAWPGSCSSTARSWPRHGWCQRSSLQLLTNLPSRPGVGKKEGDYISRGATQLGRSVGVPSKSLSRAQGHWRSAQAEGTLSPFSSGSFLPLKFVSPSFFLRSHQSERLWRLPESVQRRPAKPKPGEAKKAVHSDWRVGSISHHHLLGITITPLRSRSIERTCLHLPGVGRTHTRLQQR